jgi:hypothetical protein
MQSPGELVRRWFRWAAGLLPFDFRRDYGRDMELAFASDLNESRQAGAGGTWSTWARAVAGPGPVALREHAATALQDVRYASRMLVQNPGFTATALLSLGIGIGANTAVFSLIDALFLRPLPVQSGDRLVALYTVDARNPGFNPTSYPNYRDYKDHLRGLEDITAYTFAPVNVSTTDDPVQVLGVAVTGNYFQLLGVRPVLGRSISPDDDRITPKLADLQLYQLAIASPQPPSGSFNEAAAARGDELFSGRAKCNNCHVEPLWSDPGWNLHTPEEVCIDAFQANRAPDLRYRTAPLGALFTHTKGGFYHDGRFANLSAVVDHYNTCMNLNLAANEKSDLIQYLLSLTF